MTTLTNETNEERDSLIADLFTQVKQKIQEHPANVELSHYDAYGGTAHSIGGWANFLLREQGFTRENPAAWTWGYYFKLDEMVAVVLENVEFWPFSFKQSLLPKYNLVISGVYNNWYFDTLFSPAQRQEIACARIDWFLAHKEWEPKPAWEIQCQILQA